MKTKELRELSIEELVARRRELREEMRNLRVQQATDQLENPSRVRIVRRETARVETLLTEKQQASAPAAS